MTTLLTPLIILHQILSSILLLPLKDSRSNKSFPLMTLILVGVNVGVHVYVTYLLPTQVSTTQADVFVINLTLIPALVMNGGGHGALSMITAGFLHADWLHLGGNMFFLLFFGRKVEDLLGPIKFGLLYFICLFVSGIGSVVGEVTLPLTKGILPNLGASGAIMGVVGAYLFLYHGERIRTLLLVFGLLPIPFLPRVRVWVFIAYQIVLDVLNGLIEEQAQQFGYLYSFVNSFAHLSGIVAGMICIYLFLPSEMLHYRYRPETRQSQRTS